MPVCFLLAALLIVGLCSGCAGVSEDRLTRLESAVLDLQSRDLRLTALEQTVATLSSTGHTPAVANGASEKLGGGSLAQASPPPAKTNPGQTTGQALKTNAPLASPLAASNVSPARQGQQYQAALATLQAGHPQAALALFKAFLNQFPQNPLAPNAAYWLGECHYTLHNFTAAADAFKDVVAQYPAHDKAAAALLKVGYCYEHLGDRPAAKPYYEAVLRDFPTSEPTALARARLAAPL